MGMPFALIPAEPPSRPPPLEFRQKRAGRVVSFAVFLLMAVGFAAAPELVLDETPWPARAFAYWMAFWTGLVALMMKSGAIGVLKPGAWLLRAGPDGLRINLRSHKNYRFDSGDPTVVVIPRRAIKALRPVSEQGLRPHWPRAGTMREVRVKRQYLDILTDRAGLPEVEAALDAESERWSPRRLGIRSRNKTMGVRVIEGGILRLEWRGNLNRITPDLDAAVKTLRQWYRIAEESRPIDKPVADLRDDEREGRILELAERGDTVAAAALAGELYGMDMTAARNFVENLRR